MTFDTTFVGWTDRAGFHVVALDTARSGCAIRWSIRSTEWRSWDDGAAVIADAILGDRQMAGEQSQRNKLADLLSTAGDAWDLAGKRVARWLEQAGDDGYRLTFGVRNTGRFWVKARVALPPLHDAPDFGTRTALSVQPLGSPIVLSETRRQWHRLSSQTTRADVAVHDICRDARTAAEREAERASRGLIATVRVAGVTRTVVERELPGQPQKQRRGQAQNGDRERQRQALADARERTERDNRAVQTPWIALQFLGVPLWEGSLPEDPVHVASILNGMEKLSRGLRTGNPRQTRQGVMEFDVQRGGTAYRVIYNEHCDTSTFVVLDVVKKGRGAAQQKALASAGEAWRCFTAGDADYSVSRVDPAAMQKNLRGRAANALGG